MSSEALAKRDSEAIELRRRVAELEQQLEQSRRESGQLIHSAAHDISEAARMVGSFTQLLARRADGNVGTEAAEYIEYVISGVARLQQVVEDLLAYSRVVNAPPRPFENVDCEGTFAWVVSKLHAPILDSGALVTHEPLPVVPGDQPEIGQLFQELVENALKFHGEQPPHVHVWAREQDNDWLFSVRDSGPGINPKYATSIFRPFQRLHGRDYPGTGMGLAIAARIVERHGGRIWVESEPGAGATFLFTLPK